MFEGTTVVADVDAGAEEVAGALLSDEVPHAVRAVAARTTALRVIR
ncbi:hypothetical protein [Amycolatopsis sacchari]|nr:hypothetical protein [Amycolatopsis sacchari]